MDLSSQTRLGVIFTDNEETGITTISFAPANDAAITDLEDEIGTIEIETVRVRALMDALAIMAKERSPDQDVRSYPRMSYFAQQNRGGVTFV